MKKALIVLVTLISSNLLSTIEFQLYYNFDDCKNCNSELDRLRNLDPSFNKTIFVTEQNRFYIGEFLANHNFQPKDFTVKYLSNTFFNCTQPSCNQPIYQSFCIVNWDTKKDSFLLKDLSSQRSLFTGISQKNVQGVTIDIPDSIKVSTRLKFMVNNNVVNIFDETLNKNITLILDPAKRSIDKIIVLKRENFSIAPFFNSGCFDTTIYKKYTHILKSIGKDRPELEQAFVTDSTINLLVNVSYPKIENNDSVITFKLFLYQKNFKRMKSELFCVTNDGFSKQTTLNGSYSLNNAQPFCTYSNTVLMSVIDWKDTVDHKIVAEYILKDKNLNYKGLMYNKAIYIPHNNRKKGYMLSRYVNGSFYFVNSYPCFYDYKNKEQIVINQKLLCYEKDTSYFIVDVKRSANKINILAAFNKSLVHFVFNSTTLELIDKNKLEVGANLNTNFVRFFGSEEIILLDSNKLHIIKL